MNFWNPIEFGDGRFVWSYFIIGWFIDFLVVLKIFEFFVDAAYFFLARVRFKWKISVSVIEKSFNFICII